MIYFYNDQINTDYKIIEFVGQGGVGKSHLIEELKKEFKFKEINYKSLGKLVNLNKLIQSFKMLYLDYHLYRDKWKMFKYLFNKLVVSKELPQYSKGISLVDEGIFQFIFYSIGSRINPKCISSIGEEIFNLSCYKPDIIIQLYAQPKVILNNRKKRNRINEKSTLLEDIINEQKIFLQYNKILGNLCKKHHINLIKLDVTSNNDLEQLYNFILNVILHNRTN